MCFTITLRGVLIASLWLVGIGIAALGAIYSHNLAGLAITPMMGAATLTVCGRLDRYTTDWETAYSAGREVSKVRQMR